MGKWTSLKRPWQKLLPLILTAALLLTTGVVTPAPVHSDEEETPLIVSTDAITDIQACSATVAGTVYTTAADGRGIVFGLDANPTTDDNVVTACPTRTEDMTTWEGSFTAALTSLEPNTTYHVRAYKKDSYGVEYGEDKSFTTADGPALGWKDISANLPATAQGLTSLPQMSFINDNEGWITQYSGGYLYHTTDGGTTFESITTLPKPAVGYSIQAVAFRNSNEGYIAYHQGSVYYTDDGCETWTKISNSYDNPTVISLVPGTNKGYLCGVNGPYNFGFLCAIESASLSSVAVLGSDGAHLSMSFQDIDILPSGEGWLAGAETVVHIVNDAAVWDESCPSGWYDCVDLADENYGWAGGEGGGWYTDSLIAGTKNGMDWYEQPTPESIKYKGYPRAAFGASFTDADNGFFVGIGGLILHTTDGGNSWNLEADGLTTSFLQDVDFTSLTNAYALGNGGTLMKYGPLDEGEATTPTVTTTSPATNITAASADLAGNVTSNGGSAVTVKGFVYGPDVDPELGGAGVTNVPAGSGAGAFSTTLTGLTANTTYHVRAYATNDEGTGYGGDMAFTTLAATAVCEIVGVAPYETLDAAFSDVSGGQTIRLLQSINHSGGLSISGKHIALDLNGYNLEVVNPADDQDGLSVIDGGVALTGSGEFNVTGIRCGVYASGTDTAVVVTSATGTADRQFPGGGIHAEGGAAVTVRGDVWGYHYGTRADGTGSSIIIQGDAGSKCYAGSAASAENGGSIRIEGSATAECDVVRATGAGSAVQVLQNVTQILQYGSGATAVNGGQITIDGTINNNPLGKYITVGSLVKTPADYTTPTTLAGYRTYTDGGDPANTVWVKETTAAVPAVTTGAVTNITSSGARVAGNVTSDGGSAVTERGFVYGTEPDPTTANSKITAGSGTGAFSATLSGLAANTAYHVRAYAVNSAGAAYGEDVIFTTSTRSGSSGGGGGGSSIAAAPTVKSLEAGSLTAGAAVLNGEITSRGGAVVTAYGFSYKTAQSDWTQVQAGTGDLVGRFSCSLSGLTPNTGYLFKAWAANSAGTAYGEEKSFTTPQEEESQVPVPAPVPGRAEPPDLAGHWSHDCVMALLEHGIVTGYPDGAIRPDREITRAEAAVLLVSALGLQDYQLQNRTSPYNDDLPAWASRAILICAEKGLMNGYPDGSFRPGLNISRAEMCVALVNAFPMAAPEGFVLEFSDAAGIPGWARASIEAAAANSVVSGYPDNTFQPAGSIKRAEAFSIICRIKGFHSEHTN